MIPSDVSIIIPTWNGLDLLKRFLPSVIAASTYTIEQLGNQIEIIVVDDGGTDDTVAWLTEQGFTLETPATENQQSHTVALRIVRNPENVGFGETCNNGIKAARFPLIYLLNNDAEINADALLPLIGHFTDEKVFAAHSRVFKLETGEDCGNGQLGYFQRGLIRVHLGYRAQKEEPEQRFYSIYATGGSAMFDRRKFLELGGFDPLFSPFYWEDVEIGYKAWKRGYTIHFEPRSIVRHRISATTKKLNQRRVKLIQQRNRLIYHWIHLHDGWMFFSHILWITLIFLLSPLLFKPVQIAAFFEALKRLPQIRRQRQEERLKAKRSDREVFAIFREMRQRRDVSIIRN
jgi:GT2 family glycosyltransferase